jgi:hypothetical protein
MLGSSGIRDSADLSGLGGHGVREIGLAEEFLQRESFGGVLAVLD